MEDRLAEIKAATKHAMADLRMADSRPLRDMVWLIGEVESLRARLTEAEAAHAVFSDMLAGLVGAINAYMADHNESTFSALADLLAEVEP
jgi:hypothetical protein